MIALAKKSVFWSFSCLTFTKHRDINMDSEFFGSFVPMKPSSSTKKVSYGRE